MVQAKIKSLVFRVLFSYFILLSFSNLGYCQNADTTKTDSVWCWYDGNGNKRTRAELDTIIARHQVWIAKVDSVVDIFSNDSSNYDELFWRVIYGRRYKGQGLIINDTLRARFEKAILDSAVILENNLSGAAFTEARLRRADLRGTKFIGAYFNKADLTHTSIGWANLHRAYLQNSLFDTAYVKNSILSKAFLDHTSFKKADLRFAIFNSNRPGQVLMNVDFSDAFLVGSDLRDISFTLCSFENADLRYANLANIHSWGINFRNTILKHTILSDADISHSDFAGSIFEPDSLPAVYYLSKITNIEWLRYGDNPIALQKMKSLFVENGFKRQSKMVNTALKRSEASPLEKVFFDYTCEWGINWIRPLMIVAAFWSLFTIIYLFSIKGSLLLGSQDKYVITNFKRLKKGIFFTDKTDKKHKYSRCDENLKISLIFSTQATLRIGFRDFNLGHWSKMFLPKGFELEAYGWPRVVAGFQSLISVALIILSLLSYFTTPFEY